MTHLYLESDWLRSKLAHFAHSEEIQYRFRPRDFAHRLIKKHQLGAHLIGELEDKLCQVQCQLSLEQSGGDAIVSDFDLDSALDDTDQLERKANEAQHKKKDSIFDASKFETIRRLVQADAITNLVQLEQRLKEERRTMVKNRMISLQKMAERHSRENAESSGINDLARQEDDRIRIEEHFAKEIDVLENKQRIEFAFNTERMISDAARGRLRKVDFADLEPSIGGWEDVTGDELQHESFTVNLGNQLKITQNIRLVKCNLIDELRVRRGITQRLESLINLASERPAALVLPFETDDLSFTNRDFGSLRQQCLEMTDVVFPSFDKQTEEAKSQVVGSIEQKRFFTTRHSVLSANAHVLFHLYVGKVNHEKTIESRNPTLLALRAIIRECSRCQPSSLRIPLLFANDLLDSMTAPWCLKRAELVMKCVKGFLIEFPLSNCTIHFTLPSSIDSQVFQRVRDLIPENFRLTVALNI